MAKKSTYKVIFHQQGKVYEVYARGISQSNLYGFVEVEKLVFGERTTVLVDPSEEHLKSEFAGVTRTYIPMHAIIRIDEVQQEGVARISASSDPAGNVRPFPIYTNSPEPKKS